MITPEDCAWWKRTTLLQSAHDGKILIRKIREAGRSVPLQVSRGLFGRHGRNLSVGVNNASVFGGCQAGSVRIWGVVIKPPSEKGRYFFLPCEYEELIMKAVFDCGKDSAPADLGAVCLSFLLSEGWKVISAHDVMPGDTYGRMYSCPLFYQIEEAELGCLRLEDRFEWAKLIGNWPGLTSLEGRTSPPAQDKFDWIHSSKHIIQLEDCMWKPCSRYFDKGDPLRVSPSSLSQYEPMVDEDFQIAAKKILCYGRSMTKTAFPIRRLYWIKSPRGLGEKDVVTGVLLRSPVPPHRRIFFLYEFGGQGTMMYNFYPNYIGVICLSLLFQEGWIPDFDPSSYPGSIGS